MVEKALKLDLDIGSDARNDLRDSLADLLGPLSGLAQHWNAVRQAWRLAELSKLLPLELIDILDDLSDVNRCTEDTCFELCHDDWDFCFEHGHTS